MKNFILVFILFVSIPAFAAKTLVVLGDSLTEGYGVAKEHAYPHLLEQKFKAAGLDWKVVNSGVSGSTSASAPARLEWILKSKPDAVFLALGANDGLRGLSTESVTANLKKTIQKAKAQKLKIFLAGMQMPPNVGAEYAKKYKEVFVKVAKEENVEFFPFLLDKVGGNPKLNLADGIHPNEEGHKVMAENVYQFLKGKL